MFAHPFVNNPEAQLEKHSININGNFVSYKQNNVGKIFITQANGSFSYFSPYNSDVECVECKENPIAKILQQDGTCLIYISKASIYDNSFQDVYKSYIELCPIVKNKEALDLITELEIYLGVSQDRVSVTVEMLRRGIVLHHGSIPLKARYILEKFVNNKFAKICFATSTLIQGINMPFDLVWIRNFRFSGSDSAKILNLKNLIGRAGRSTNNPSSLDYGFVVVDSENIDTFNSRLNINATISSKSLLDEESENYTEDYRDVVDSIKDDTFADEYNMPQIQVERLKNQSTENNIKTILDYLLPEGDVISAKDYYSLPNPTRDKIKKAFKAIFKSHLRRETLSRAEQAILSASIPILLWQIQGKSFAEIVTLRHNYLSCKKERSKLTKELNGGLISTDEYGKLLNNLRVPFSNKANQLPDIKLSMPFGLYKRGTSVIDVDFDTVIYDTYDYIDKVISFSLKDPFCVACKLFYEKHKDERANVLYNYIAYGTNDEKEIWLIKYGFSFEDIEWLYPYIQVINADGITFFSNISFLDHNKKAVIERYV